jgi:hypothetical protein
VASLHVDLLQLGAERIEHLPGASGVERRPAQPFPEVAGSRRTVRAEEPPGRLEERFAFVHLAPAVDPPVGADERHLRPLRRSLTQLVEEERESRAQAPPRTRPDPLHDLRGQLLSQHASPDVENVANSLPDDSHVFGSEGRVDLALRIPPRLQSRGWVGHGASRGVPQREIAGGMQVQGSPKGPRLHQVPALPQGVPDVVASEGMDTSGELELRRGLDLRVDAAHLPDDLHEPIGVPRFRSHERASRRARTRSQLTERIGGIFLEGRPGPCSVRREAPDAG